MFFCSSRRRHTIYWRDWSSDVCSSDLNSIITLEQTPDGYLWGGTWEGLVRFDGARFTVFDESNTPALPGRSIRNLALGRDGTRSEEHTSELQSRQYLVCRLLLEKKKTNQYRVKYFVAILI